MKIIFKTIFVGGISLMLTACGTTEKEDNIQTGGQDLNGSSSEESQIVLEPEGNKDVNEEEEFLFPVLDSTEDEIRIELNGEEIILDATYYTTTFDKEIKVLDGMSFTYREEGQPAAIATFEEGHLLSDLNFIVEENLIYDGENVLTREVDVARDIHLETSLLGTAGHVNDYNVHELDESLPFHYVIEVVGDATKPGNWADSIRGKEYRQFTFVEVTEHGRYYVKLQFPVDVDEEIEATALALALSYQSVKTIDVDEE
ncbi:hypothetical protein [Evansella tamaricis]|uniref:Lipoprotein n=1 Tax=Evansella tamaricis TaxID=2069301 RepID=A0ABS6JAF0_9BACI|nr:hypothetical protein [Evansella tamaricis]MBU9710667.1 hypothetical protein [Evansella tamaricis]